MFVPYLAHNMDGTLLFCWCGTCASNGQIQRICCSHNERERSWIDVYTSIDTEHALLMVYKIYWNTKKSGVMTVEVVRYFVILS